MEINLDNYSEIEFGKIQEYKELLLKDKIEIISKNENGIINVIPYNKIDFLFDKNNQNNILFHNSKYYIYSSYLEMIGFFVNPEKLDDKNYFYSIFTNCKDPKKEVSNKEEAMIEEMLSITPYERVEHIKKLISSLEAEESKEKFTCKAAEIIGEVLVKLALMNRINVIADIGNNSKFDTKIYNINYEDLIRSIAESVFVLLNKPYEKVNIFNEVIGFTGHNIIDHSNRLFVNTMEFMIFYNKNINMGMLSKIRAKWKNEFMPYYVKIASKYKFIRDISKLDNIFKLGIRHFDNIEIINISIAALLHDITLTETINYLPIKNSNVNNELYTHSVKSYNYLKCSICNNQDINLAVGLHHEYYGYGYGLAITLYEAMKSKRPNFEYQYLITFDSKDILNLNASVYYPVKILEILDIYDLLKYKYEVCFNEINTDIDIINYMYDNFLKDEVKIDYILFTIFQKYLIEIKDS